MRLILLHEQLLITISIITAVVACSAGFDWWRGKGALSARTLVVRGIWALLMASEIILGIIMVSALGQPLVNPLHLVYGIVALLVTASVIWVVPRLFVAPQQARSLTIAMVIVAVVLHRLAVTGG